MHSDGIANLRPKAAAEHLGVCVSRLRQLEKKGLLHPLRDRVGIRHYSRIELERLARQRSLSSDNRIKRGQLGVPGEMAARAFELFDKQWTLPQIVRELRCTPETVRALYVEYSTPIDQVPNRSRLAPEPLPPGPCILQ